MKNKIKIGIIIFFIIIFGFCIVSNAAISTQSKEVKSGEQFTISVTSNVSLVSYKVKVESYSGLTFVTSTGGTGEGTTSIANALTSGGATSLATFTFKAPEVTKDTTYTIKFVATEMGDENFETVGDSSSTSTITVKAPVVETPQEPSTPPATTTPEPETPTVTKSSEARLKSFGIRPTEYDFSGFSKNPDKENWSAEVPNSVTSVEVYAEPKDSKAKVSGDGKVTLNEGNNKIGIKVTAEDGTTKTYTLTIKRKTAAEEDAENGENRLKSLSIKPEEYDFTGFNSETTEYIAEVPNEVEQIEISATAMDSKAQITGTGMIDLEEGENELKIEVIAVNGDKKTYTLTVTRLEAEKTEEFGLLTLSIKGIKLSPSFKIGTYEYTATLEEDLTSLEITAKANSEEATVEIVGNENLKDGENVITILVENKETEEVATYQIIINKNVAVVEEVEQTSWLKPSTWGKEEKIKIAIIIVLIILIICAIILKIKISKQSKNAKKVGLPGAEELDRAIAEHQELSEGTNYEDYKVEETIIEMNNFEGVNKNNVEQNYIEEIAKNRFWEKEDETGEKPKRRGRHF